MNHSRNILRIKAVSNALDKLKEKVVFAGGATVSLYADRVGFDVRPTDDVDVIIEILNYKDRSQLEERLRNIGFEHDVHSRIVCRYIVQGITVDIMPTADDSVGFKNIWYPEGFEQAIDFSIDQNRVVKILAAPYFVATKLEAFKGRGNANGRTSHDFEDIVYVLENRSKIWNEFDQVGPALKTYLKEEFSKLLDTAYIIDWIECHVERSEDPNTDVIIQRMKTFTAS